MSLYLTYPYSGRSQLGRVNEQGHYPEWYEDHLVNFNGHSAGAQVFNVLQQMLVDKSEVFVVAFGLLVVGAVILTLNVLLLGGHITFFQSLSLLGYCLFPLDVEVLVWMLAKNVIMRIVVVIVTFAWSLWYAYPFMSTTVNPRRKALALYPVLLMYVSVDFLIIAIN